MIKVAFLVFLAARPASAGRMRAEVNLEKVGVKGFRTTRGAPMTKEGSQPGNDNEPDAGTDEAQEDEMDVDQDRVRAWPDEVPAEENQGAEKCKEDGTDAEKALCFSEKMLASAKKTVEEATAYAFDVVDEAIASEALKDELGPNSVAAIALLAALARAVPSDARLRLVCYMAIDTIKLAISEMQANAMKSGEKLDGSLQTVEFERFGDLKKLLNVVNKATRGLKVAKFKASASWAVAKTARAGGNTADALAQWYEQAKDFAERRIVPGIESAITWVKQMMSPKKANTKDKEEPEEKVKSDKVE